MTTKDPRGVELLQDPALNKGMAFSERERDALGLRGLLPPRVATLDEQVLRVLNALARKTDALEKYIYLMALQDRNETLFFRVVLDHLEETMPLLYTPTVGQACQVYGQILRRPRGLFVSSRDRGRVADVLRNWPRRDVRVIVVTDGERILGLGDLGANGMGIPVGKLALYTACAGVDPAWCLPILLDVGTDNARLHSDPLYIGVQEKRLRGEAYDAFVDEFIAAVRDQFPRAIVQLEDFGNANAFRLLDRYRRDIRTFDDDIQGTAGVTLAGLYSALRINGRRLKDQTILFFGAGEAGIGIADLVLTAMADDGVDKAAARARCWFVDSKGLVIASRTDLNAHKRAYAHDHPPVANLEQAIDSIKPTAIIGVSGVGRTFTRGVVEAMSRHNERPIVFALSNPTSQAECTAEEAYTWSRGRAIYASGSPFDPVVVDGKRFVPGQGNNAYIFPGVGLGVIASSARLVTDEMFFVAAKTLDAEVTDADLAEGRIYPPIAKVRDVSLAIATAVADVAWQRGLAETPIPSDLREHIKRLMYEPVYSVPSP
jgi:malate dehydrogenase (oxaloacetate-decarboxylating)(NADP+)